MLKTLHIENVAVIEKADVELAPGLNVLTGETGAGKTIVIDSLGAVLGGRTSKDLVRSGANSASITAVFSSENVQSWCEENGIEPEDEEIFIMRRISSDGKNTCRVNGIPVSVSQLRELGRLLLDIHGQNDGQKLLDEKFHRQYLDSFGKMEETLREYQKEYSKYTDIKKEIESLDMDEREKQIRIDTLRFQTDELRRAEIRPGEREEKTKRRDLLQNAGKLSGAVDDAFFALYGSDRADGAISLISQAKYSVFSATRYSDEFSEIEKSLTDMEYTAQDIAEQLRDIRESLDFSPEELDELESRLALLRKLSVKYGDSEEEMLQYLERCEEELDSIEYSADKIERLHKELEKQHKITLKAAEKLSSERAKAAKELEERIRSELASLSMPKVQFKVRIEKLDEVTASGMDEVRFEMSANAGEKPGRISKIASGGELSRIMLAMKNVLAENDTVETMVFDEIDTGVSGIAAQRVGEKLASLARGKQVICVTHLPQIAVMADDHYEIKKEESEGRTYTKITKLDSRGRNMEIARLTGGENITETTIIAAGEQIKAAAEYKKSIAG